MPASPYALLASKGCGSAVVEACLELAGLAYAVEELDYGTPGPGRDRLRGLNPLGQVPVLILPSGMVMTESAAMVLHIADRAPGCGLVPALDDPARPAFLRWLVYLVASVYPNFTYGDEPARYVPDEAAGRLRASTDAYCQRLWQLVEAEVEGEPWLLGSTFSALDLYVTVMSRWRPRRDWFAAHCPRLHEIALRVEALPALAGVWARNYG